MSSARQPFHRLLTFFAKQSHRSTSASPQTATITFLDSLKGDLALGLNFPFSVLLSLVRHVIFRTDLPAGTSSRSGFLSFLAIHIPSVKTDRELLGGPDAYSFDPTKRYAVTELRNRVAGRGGSAKDQLDAIGIWMLAAARKDGKISGSDARAFQEGTVLEKIAERRRGREDVLPFWRGGPISVAGHAWAVRKIFDVHVYQRDAAVESKRS